MVKNRFNKIKSVCPVNLAILGWVAFAFGVIVKPIGLKLVLLLVARVLPEALRPV